MARDQFATTIANDAVTYAKMQNVTDARLIGRSAGTSGDPQEITVGAGLTLSGGALTASAGGTTWTDIGDATADTTIALGAFETDWTSTIDSAGKAVWTITNTDADAAADNAFLDLRHNDGADANVFYARFIGDNDGTPVNDYLFSQTAFTIGQRHHDHLRRADRLGAIGDRDHADSERQRHECRDDCLRAGGTDRLRDRHGQFPEQGSDPRHEHLALRVHGRGLGPDDRARDRDRQSLLPRALCVHGD